MHNKKTGKSGFTFIELMVAMGIGGIVLSTMTALLVQGLTIWKDFSTQWLLCQQSRIARERILRSTFGMGGLRSAIRSDLEWDDNAKELTFTKIEDTNSCYTIGGQQNGMLCQKSNRVGNGNSGTQQNVSTNITTEFLDFEMNGDYLTCEYELNMQSGKRVYTTVGQVSAHLLNE